MILPQETRNLQLLRGALGDLDAWRRWSTQVDLVHDELAGDVFHLLPLIYQQLDRQGVDDPQKRRLKGIYKYAWVQNQRALQSLADIVVSLQEEQIEPMVVGDAAVAMREDWLRPILSTFLIVPYHQLARTFVTLQNKGWKADKPTHHDVPSLKTPINFSGPQKMTITVDWRAISSRNATAVWQGEQHELGNNAVNIASKNAQAIFSVLRANLDTADGLLNWVDFARLWQEPAYEQIEALAHASWLKPKLQQRLSELEQIKQCSVLSSNRSSSSTAFQRSTLLVHCHNYLHLPQLINPLRYLAHLSGKNYKPLVSTGRMRRRLKG